MTIAADVPTPLKLDARCLESLRAAVKDGLNAVRIQNGKFIDSDSLSDLAKADAVLPKNGIQHDLVRRYVGERPISNFVFARLAAELSDKEYRKGDDVVPLSTMEGHADLNATAARMVADFNSLPWLYTISVPIPAAVGDVFREVRDRFVISENVRFSVADEEFKSEYTEKAGVRRPGMGTLASLIADQVESIKWEDRAYLQVRANGFIGKYEIGAPYEFAMDLLKAVWGMGIAMRLWKMKREYGAFREKTQIYVHRWIRNVWTAEERREFPLLESEVLQDLVPDDLGGKIEAKGRASWMAACFFQMGSVFAAGERGQRVLLGARWLFDSYCGGDELLAYIRAAVVMETLLGDKARSDLVGLGELISNRCAYLISNSTKERDEIMRDFRDIYEVRSSIVHQGKTRLSDRERELFYRLRWMGFRVIQEEVKLLYKEDQEAKKS